MVPLGFIGFNKPPIEGDQIQVETNRVHYVSVKTNTSPSITSKTITNVVMVLIFFFFFSTLPVITNACNGSHRPGHSSCYTYRTIISLFNRLLTKHLIQIST